MKTLDCIWKDDISADITNHRRHGYRIKTKELPEQTQSCLHCEGYKDECHKKGLYYPRKSKLEDLPVGI